MYYIHVVDDTLLTPRVAVVLAGNFPMTQGSVEVTIPWLLSDSDYSAVRKYSLHSSFTLVANVCFKLWEIQGTTAPIFLSPDLRHFHPIEP